MFLGLKHVNVWNVLPHYLKVIILTAFRRSVKWNSQSKTLLDQYVILEDITHVCAAITRDLSFTLKFTLNGNLNTFSCHIRIALINDLKWREFATLKCINTEMVLFKFW